MGGEEGRLVCGHRLNRVEICRFECRIKSCRKTDPDADKDAKRNIAENSWGKHHFCRIKHNDENNWRNYT